jgi:membrane-bound metal-dependent hydrolase YbcI (DUF457 family)
LVARWRGARFIRSAGLASLLVASHGLLDILNTGSKVAILWPFSFRYYSVPWQPIPAVSQLSELLTAAGPRVVAQETLLFLPLWLIALWPFLRKRRGP